MKDEKNKNLDDLIREASDSAAKANESKKKAEAELVRKEGKSHLTKLIVMGVVWVLLIGGIVVNYENLVKPINSVTREEIEEGIKVALSNQYQKIEKFRKNQGQFPEYLEYEYVGVYIDYKNKGSEYQLTGTFKGKSFTLYRHTDARVEIVAVS